MTAGKQAYGFSLLELLITLSIVAILAGLAAPSLVQQIQQDRLTSQANQLQAVFRFARGEAVKREQSVLLVAEERSWRVLLEQGGTETEIQRFNIEYDAIQVTLADMQIRRSGEVFAERNLVISDDNPKTTDYRLCILISGQSWLVNEEQACNA